QNFNLHPRLMPWEIEYPGCVANRAGGRVLTLRDLEVEADPALRRLRLVSRLDGLAIELQPQNLLHPSDAPSLYRFLLSFASTAQFRRGLWRQYGAMSRPGARPSSPEVAAF